ncbi:hypothetical protein CSC94_00680 [Zhengella mangrovi]|uniref:Ricin B lectin domain-containing protein n=1 Tax=Zhengella mangrovi TaxID=1982044 RepID=A0A2G1QTL7_9HYPH|nr:RICIN domain-containing protein [Zhengella mangrovi]PHP68558.1 hypothetical protein CSC94_00680 [Zhengella mangrovi]
MRMIATAAAGLLAMMTAVQAQPVVDGIYYTLSTEFRGPDMRLDVVNGGPLDNLTHLVPAEDVSGQYWHFIDEGNGYYRLTTMFRGEDMCLDVFNGGDRNNQVHLTQCGNYSGQFWLISGDDSGYFRLTTQFRGPRHVPRHLQWRTRQQHAAPDRLRELFRPVLGNRADRYAGAVVAAPALGRHCAARAFSISGISRSRMTSGVNGPVCFHRIVPFRPTR